MELFAYIIYITLFVIVGRKYGIVEDKKLIKYYK